MERDNVKIRKSPASGTLNGLLPAAQVFATQSNAGLAGTPRVVFGQNGHLYGRSVCGRGHRKRTGTDFPAQLSQREYRRFRPMLRLHNRQAQADYAIDQLSLRQQQLSTAKDMNQAQVDVTNSVVALRQARARYDAAVQSRILQQQLYDAEEKKFTLGASTPYNVVVQQRDLATAQAAELAALVTYQSARISLDQTTGATLDVNHISLPEAEQGRIAEPSSLPASLPDQK